jgi:hypothetical protein
VRLLQCYAPSTQHNASAESASQVDSQVGVRRVVVNTRVRQCRCCSPRSQNLWPVQEARPQQQVCQCTQATATATCKVAWPQSPPRLPTAGKKSSKPNTSLGLALTRHPGKGKEYAAGACRRGCLVRAPRPAARRLLWLLGVCLGLGWASPPLGGHRLSLLGGFSLLAGLGSACLQTSHVRVVRTYSE